MPSNLKRLVAYLTDKEARQLKKDAKRAKMTVSNYLRVKAGFDPLPHGANAHKRKARGR